MANPSKTSDDKTSDDNAWGALHRANELPEVIAPPAAMRKRREDIVDTAVERVRVESREKTKAPSTKATPPPEDDAAASEEKTEDTDAKAHAPPHPKAKDAADDGEDAAPSAQTP